MYSITYGELIDKMRQNLIFFSSESSISKTIRYALQVSSNLIKKFTNISMITGDGFPYYVAYLRNPTLPVSEIKRFHEELIQFYSDKTVSNEFYERNKEKYFSINELRLTGFKSIGRDDPYELEKYHTSEAEIDIHIKRKLRKWYELNYFMLNNDNWSYVRCLESDEHKAYGDKCPLCAKSLFKPRNILRLFHDLDIQVIIDGNIDELAQEIREYLIQCGYYNSSSDIERTLSEVGTTFPLDLTLISRNEFIKGLGVILQSTTPIDEVLNVIKLWGKNESTIWPVGINIHYSLEPLLVQEIPLYNALLSTKNELVRKHGIINIMKNLQRLPRAHGRILLDENALEGITIRLLSKKFLLNLFS
jgi:hypothetical protein